MRDTGFVDWARLARCRRGVPVGLVFVLAGAPEPAPTPTPTPAPTPPPLRLAVEKQVEKMLEERDRKGLPRFEETIDVTGKATEGVLERQLRGFDLECGPDGGGPPSQAEMRAMRPHPSPSLDFLALGRAIAGKVRQNAPSRFFLYRVRRGTDVSYIVREGVIPDSEFYNTAGASFELVQGFPDLKAATAAWGRMERGFDRPVPSDSASPLPPWSTAPCRPRK